MYFVIAAWSERIQKCYQWVQLAIRCDQHTVYVPVSGVHKSNSTNTINTSALLCETLNTSLKLIEKHYYR